MKGLKGKRILLIGGAGFIGQRLVEACAEVHMCITIVDAVSQNLVSIPGEAEYLQGDYREPGFIREIVGNADYVVHLAHDTMLLDIACDMNAEIKRNVMPAVQLMDLCSHSGVSKLLFVSSGGTVYGNPVNQDPIVEDSTTRPVSVYGTTKLMIENLGFVYFTQKGLPFMVARPSNAYGQGQAPFRGQGFIATALGSARLGRPITVYGDGSVVRDYIHVNDIAKALLALLAKGHPGEAYNVGTGHGVSLKALMEDYLAPILATDGYGLSVEYKKERRADVAYNVLANTKLLRDTGFVPETRLEDGLRSTWEWIKTNVDEFEKCHHI